MWTSERRRVLTVQEPAAELGMVTLGENPGGVSLGGERRWMPLCCPGGYAWRPAVGEKVLVIKAGAEQESPCVAGVFPQQEDLQPGEVRLFSGEARVELAQGELDLKGRVKVNGTDLEDYVQQIVYQILSAMGG